MTHLTKLNAVLFALLIIVVPSITLAADTNPDVQKLLDKMPTQTTADEKACFGELLKLCPAAVGDICAKLTDPDIAEVTKARYALSGLTQFLKQPNPTYETALLDNLKSMTDAQAKAFVMEQLRRIGTVDSIEPLSGYLTDADLYDPAARAIVTIGTDKAAGAFLKALPNAKGRPRIAIIRSLGQLRSTEAAGRILTLTKADDADTRLAALYAIANIAPSPERASFGASKAAKALQQATLVDEPYERSRAVSYYLLYAKRIAESGHKKQAEKICRQLLTTPVKTDQNNAPCAALTTLAEIKGEDVLADLLGAVASDNEYLQQTAVDLAAKIPGEAATKKWANALSSLSPSAKAKTIAMLARRKDPAAADAVKKALADSNKPVQLAAIAALPKLDPGAAEALLDILKDADADRIAAVKTSLSTMPGKDFLSAAIAAIPDLPSASQIAIIEIISDRSAQEHIDTVFTLARSDSPEVRKAAIKALENLVGPKDLPATIKLLVAAVTDSESRVAGRLVLKTAKQITDPEKRIKPLLASLKNASEKAKADILSVIARLGGKEALQTIVNATKSKTQDTKDAAIRALANWADTTATEQLLNVIKSEKEVKYQVLALRGYLRLVEKAKLTDDQKIAKHKDLFSALTRADDKRIAIASLARIKTEASVKLLMPMLYDGNLRMDACRAVVKVACPSEQRKKGLDGVFTISALTKLQSVCKDKDLKTQAAEHLARIPKASSEDITGIKSPPEGFTAIFNGKDLSGWKGLAGRGGNPLSRAKMALEERQKDQQRADKHMQDHWFVEKGILFFDGVGSSLCTAKDYGDFEMYADWKIGPKGDSGVYLRGSPQVQIWDTSRINAGAQVGSGGLYNNKKNPRNPLVCADNPVGQWNTFRIKMVGDKVTVHLNGKLVVDNTTLENYWDYSKPIFDTGQIELQCHGDPVWWRNVFIKEIPRQPKPDAEGFTPLFNGIDLTGWVGDIKGYVVENGNIVCKPGGNLYTAKKYGDFHLKFDFLLTPGANNGLGIRTPLKGNAAYAGMELQILDNSADQYKNLKPYQFHGSIYGVVPAERGFQKPVGQWNHEEVIAKGKQIKVVLNGHTIVDADIEKASTPETIDHNKHPGLLNESGHIGFLGHGSHVEFRNIKIKELN